MVGGRKRPGLEQERGLEGEPMNWAANPHQWALDAGLPEPEEGETWVPYLFRLGLLDIDIENLMVELTDRTQGLLAYRFTDYLRKHGFAQQWTDYVEERIGGWMTDERRLELDDIRQTMHRLGRPSSVAA